MVALLLSFGSRLTIAGHGSIPLPWRIVKHLPLASATVPARLVLYVWFALAIAIALWLAMPTRWKRAQWAVVVIGAVLILPNGNSILFSGRPDLPSFFTGQAYRRELSPHSEVLILPFGSKGYSMLWQAETNFYFRMPEGYLSSVTPAPFGSEPVVVKLLTTPLGPVAVPALWSFLHRYGVTKVLVDALTPGGWPAELAEMGLKGVRTQGVIFYEVDQTAHVAAPRVVTPKRQSASPSSATLSAQATYGAGLTHVVGSPVSALTPQLGNEWRELGRVIGRLLLSPAGRRTRQFEFSMAVVAPKRVARLEILTSEGQRAIVSVRTGSFQVITFGPLLTSKPGRIGLALISVAARSSAPGPNLLISPIQAQYLAQNELVTRMPALAELGNRYSWTVVKP